MSGSGYNEEFFNQLERLMMADPVEAAERARSEIATIDRESSIADQLRVRRMLVMALAHASQFEQALTVAEDALRLEHAMEAPEERARLRLASMQPLAHLGRIDEAMAAGEQARSVLEELGSEALAGRASLNLGAIQAMTGHHQESLDSFDRALRRLEDDPMLTGQIQTNRGSALTALDRFEDAEDALSNAASLLGDELPWAAAVVEGNLADLAARQGELHRSLRHFEASRRYLEQEDALGDVGRLDAEEATILSMLGMNSLATDLFTHAESLLEEHGTPSDLAMARLGFGRALANAGELDQAKALLTSITIDAEESPDFYRQYLGLSAHIAIGSEDWETAESIIETGINHVGERRIQKASWQLLQAEVAESRGDLTTAANILRHALDVTTSAHISPMVASIYEHLSTIARAQGDDERADAHARRAIEGYEGIRGTIQADQMRKVWHQGRLGIYGDFAVSLMQRDDADAQREAFEIVERIRGRSLLDAVQQSGASVSDSTPTSSDEEPLLQELKQLRRWLNWTYSSLAMGQELTEDQRSELAAREQAAQRLEDRLAMLRPQFGFHTPVDLTSVQQHLREEEVLLSYLVVDGGVTLQVVDREAVHSSADLVDTASLSELVSAMQFQIGRALISGTTVISPRREARLKRDMDLVLEQLYEMLIQPVEHFIEGKKHCIVIPSGDLHSVPFAALRRDGHYLTDHLDFTTAPGVSILMGMAGEQRDDQFKPVDPLVVGIGDDIASGMSEEASRIAERMNPVTLMLDSNARKDPVAEAMQHADLVHMACHGRFDPAFPTASGLQLADGWLTLDDIRNLRMNQPLLVLSGCETGRARVEQGDDLVGLMTAMISSGAGELVTSLWKTHDHAAMAFMEAFYTALERGESTPEALRTSQTEVQNTFAHPAMWAPFVAISRTSRGKLA